MTIEDPFTLQTQEFKKCLEANKVTISPSVQIADLRSKSQGRGLVATEYISANEPLFTLPCDAVLNHETCDLFINMDSQLANDLLEKYNQWEILILCLFYETSLENSRFQGYFNVLPKTFDTLMFWSEEELKLLEPSLVLNRIGRKESEEMLDNVKIAAKEAGLTKELSLEEFHRLASWVQCYSFDVDGQLYDEAIKNKEEEKEVDDEDEDEEVEQEQIKTMVCLADTLNADTHLVNANLTYENQALVMKSTKSIKKGEQIYNTYGEHPNSEILRRYGYVEWGGSKYDFGEISLENIRQYFTGKYKIETSIFDALIETIGADSELSEETGVISDSYECFIDPEITPEFQFLIQMLTSVFKIESSESKHKFSASDKGKYVKRFTKKIIQLINSKKITVEAQENYVSLLNKKIDEYPKDLVLVSLKLDVPKVVTRKEMATCILKCEVNAFKSCKTYFEKAGFSSVEDERLERNLLSKYQVNEKTEKRGKRKRE